MKRDLSTCWLLLTLACATLTVTACDRQVGRLSVTLTRSARVAHDEPLDPAVVRALRVRADGPDFTPSVLVFDFAEGGSSALEGLPVGEQRVLTVDALTSRRGSLVSRAESTPLSIEPGDNTVELFIARVGRVSAAPDASLPTPRWGARMAPLPGGDLLVVGGAAAGTEIAPIDLLTQILRVDGDAGRIRAAGHLAHPRVAHALFPVEGGVLVVGGRDEEGPVAELELCDADGCTAHGSLDHPRWGGGAAAVTGQPGFGGVGATGPQGGLYVGGFTANGPSDVVTRIASDGTLSELTLPVAIARPTVGVTVDGDALILGGELESGASDAVWRLAMDADAAVPVPATGFEASSLGAAVDVGAGRLLFAGGRLADGRPRGALHLYDPVVRELCLVGELEQPRWGHALTLLRDGRVLLTGGRSIGNQVERSVRILDPRAIPAATTCAGLEGTVTIEPEAPFNLTHRTDHAVGLAGNGFVFLAGGVGAENLPLDVLDAFVGPF